MKVTSGNPAIGAVVEFKGGKLRHPVSKQLASNVIAEMKFNPVVVIRHDRPLTDVQQIAFSRLLGPVEKKPVLKTSCTKGVRVKRSEIIDQSNLDETGKIFSSTDRRRLFKLANRLWHTDMSFHPIRATYSLLSARELPQDGAPPTEFIDMRVVYDSLDPRMKKKIECLVAEHSYWHSRVLGGGPIPTKDELASRPPAQHRLVHNRKGRKSLYLASHASHIVGWPKQTGRELLDELMAFATQSRFVYTHTWKVGDLLIWDNLLTMHRARPFSDLRDIRDVRRTTCREMDPNTN